MNPIDDWVRLGAMKLKALDSWPPQEWKAETQTLAPEDALDGIDVSASIPVDDSDRLALTVIHNGQTYAGSMTVPQNLAKRMALVISGASPSKTLREIGELELESEVSQ
jgi:hypothetical protein